MRMAIDLQQINRDVTIMLQSLYGDRLERIILYGSYARGDFHDESDVDYLAILSDQQVSTFSESARIAPITDTYYLETSIALSVFAIAGWQFNTLQKPLFKQIQQEGKAIYGRAVESVHS